MSTAPVAETPVRVLLVDDNKIYRDAFRRNLALQNYTVFEAENTEQALQSVEENQPHVIITDLQMRTETEGLDLIRAVKSSQPLLPIVMISAVGTFEEGALAQEYGAAAVLSKSRIENEIERLYSVVERSHQQLHQWRQQEQILDAARNAASTDGADTAPAAAQLQDLVANPDTHPYLRQEAYSVYADINSRAFAEAASSDAAKQSADTNPLNPVEFEAELRRELPTYDALSADSRESLRIAEFLYRQQTNRPDGIDFSRNVGFSYCFAVENEAKVRTSKRLQKFLANDMTYRLVMEMMEPNQQSLSVNFHQYLLLLLRQHPMEFTVDNVKQVFKRMLEHQGRYKPDGLKALGIMMLVFGRSYSWMKNTRTIKIVNPLSLRGLEPDEDTLNFAKLLIGLQHFRNPYIHPEISDMEKLSIIRKTAFQCLNLATRLV